MSQNQINKGVTVTLSATGINLILGILYAWSVIKGGIPDSWGWTNADKALPYSVACILFSVAMIPAGRLQDKIGPRWVATIGGLLMGLGCIIAGLSGSNLSGFVIGFGVFFGLGMGFGYASATPPAVKWFPPQKTGLIAGIVVAGFGLASVYIAPLATKLLSFFSTSTGSIDPLTQLPIIEKGVSQTMITFGIFGLIFITILSQFLRNPPEDHQKQFSTQKTNSQTPSISHNKNWREMLIDPQFYILWIMFFIGSGAGLTFISVAQDLGKRSLGELAFIAVAILAIGNAGGRILAGSVSDKIGRAWTLFICFTFQAFIITTLYFSQTSPSWIITMAIVLFIGANYGANLALFPSITKDYFGLKNFGMNYGVLFTAWGVSGLVLPWIKGFIKDQTGRDDLSYFIIISICILGALLTFVSRNIAAKKAS